MRAGGATAFFDATEDIERLRRRARWRTADTADIYVQEVTPQEYLAAMPAQRRLRLMRIAAFFDEMVHETLVKQLCGGAPAVP